MAVSFIGGGHRSTRWTPLTCRKSLTILFCIILYRVHLAWAGFELTPLVVVGTDWIYSCNYNYHTITITTKTFPNLIQIHNNYMHWLFYILLCLLILCCYRILFCWVLLLSCTGWRPIKCSQCPLWKLCWIAVVVRNSSSFCLHWLMQTLYIQRSEHNAPPKRHPRSKDRKDK